MPVIGRPDGISRSRKLVGAIQSAVVPLLLLTLWEVAVRATWWPRALIASPVEVVVDFGRLMANGKLAFHAMVSLRRLSAGFLVGTGVGVGLGTLVGLSRPVERALAPTVQLLAPIPVVAWIPLFIILFGIGEASKIAIIAVGTFFVVFFNTVQGIRATDRKLVEVAYVFNKSRAELVMAVLLPSALASILTGLRVALGLSWILLIVAEVIASSEGLGWLIWDSRNFSRADDLIVGMIAVGILGKLSDQGLLAVERRLLRWRQTFEGA
jgi:sulfonate transport system permease protein